MCERQRSTASRTRATPLFAQRRFFAGTARHGPRKRRDSICTARSSRRCEDLPTVTAPTPHPAGNGPGAHLHRPPVTDRREPPAACDVAVVGAGILGLAVAREALVRRPGTSVVVLEREDDVARHQTSHNSGVVHAGLYYTPGSLKARLCVEGARRLYALCDELGVPTERCGKLVVARRADELTRLDELERRARANGVPVTRVAAAGIEALEPHARGVGALHSPDTGIVDFARLARALREDVEARGGLVATGCGVDAVRSGGVRHAFGVTRAGIDHLLRRPAVGSPRAAQRRLGGPADRALPRRLLPAAAPGARARAHLPRARPGPPVPGRPSHAASPGRRRRRPDGAPGRCARRLPPWARATRRRARHACCGPAPGAWRGAGGATR